MIYSYYEIMREEIKYYSNGKSVFVLDRCLLDYRNNFLSHNSEREFDDKFNMWVQSDVIYRVWSIILHSNCFKTSRRDVHALQKVNLNYRKQLLLWKMAGRKRAIAIDQTCQLFGENQNKIIDERRKVIPPKLAIWEELRKDSRIKKQMTAKALYTDALKWWEKRKNQTNAEVDVPSIANIRSESTSKNISSVQSHHEQVQNISSSSLDTLERLKTSNEFQTIIHLTGVCPFFVIYGSPKQFLLYTSYKLANTHTKITCESAGGHVHKICNY